MRPICRRPWCTQDRWAKSGSKKIGIGRNICSIREYHRPCSGLTAWTAMVDARFGHWPILSALKVLKGSAEMKHALASLTIGACLLLPSASVVFAAGQPGTSAGVNCGGAGPASSGLMTPGQAAASPGAPFNEPAPVGIGSGGVAGAGLCRVHGNTVSHACSKRECRVPVRRCLLAGHDPRHDPPAAVARPCPAHRRLQ